MKKGIFIGALLITLGLSLDSCKKCYVCTLTTQETINSVVDSTVHLRTELCSGKNGAGPDLQVSIRDIESNGYTCVQQ